MLLLILLLALLLGGVGLFVETLWWMLIISGALVIAGFLMGYGSGPRSGRWGGW